MDRVEIVTQLFRKIEAAEWFDVGQMVTDDFSFQGPLPTPIEKSDWIKFHEALHVAFPDWKIHTTKLEEKEDVVEVNLEISGTHKGSLDLPIPFIPSIPASGKKIHLPMEGVMITFKEDKIFKMESPQGFHQGIGSLFEQLGLE